jgi:hypothetical protein
MAKGNGRCGDPACWCVESSGVAVAPGCEGKNAADQQRHPFHRGWWQTQHRDLYRGRIKDEETR